MSLYPLIKILLVTAALIVLLGGLWFWYIFISTHGHSMPEQLPGMEDEPPHAVFVYGSLTRPSVRWLILGHTGDPEPATLPGHRRDGLNLETESDAYTEGLVLHVSSEELRRLDRYERLGIRYDRVRIRLKSGQEAWTYIRL